MEAASLLVGRDRDTTVRHLRFAAVLFLLAAVSALAWWLLTDALSRPLADLLSVERYVVAEIQLVWAYGLLGAGTAGALLVAYENGGVLVSVAISALTVAGYFLGGILAGVPYDGVVGTSLRYGVLFGGFGFLLGMGLARLTGSPGRDDSAVRRPWALVALFGGFLTASLLFSAFVWWLRSFTG